MMVCEAFTSGKLGPVASETIASFGRAVVGPVCPLGRDLPSAAMAHIDWLLDGPVRLENGMLAAWEDDGVPSFPYAESTAYAVTFLCYLYRITGRVRFRDEAIRTARALAAHREGARWLGRNNAGYLFDTVVGVRAIGALFATFPEVGNESELEPVSRLYGRLAETVDDWIRRRVAAEGYAATDLRWSNRFNVHLIKALHHVAPLYGGSHQSGYAGLRAEELLAERLSGGWLTTEPDGRTYLHAHCYGLEGLIASDGPLPANGRSVLVAGAGRLADAQRADGGIPRWWPDEGGRAASDATAQSVRIWQCVDPAGYRESIARGLEFLRRRSHPGGGVLYAADRPHRNTWATMFTLQAMIWQHIPPESRWIL